MKTQRYNFIDLIRVISMMGIVWVHTEIAVETKDKNFLYLHIPMMQIWKFGVINFFIISGFLLKEKLDLDKKVGYLKNRLQSILRPYLIALTVVFLITYISAYIKGTVNELKFSIVFNNNVLHTVYWFIPNYFICLCTLLVANKWIKSYYFGALLLAVTLYYSFISVYVKSNTISHTELLFAYIFFLWLGYQLNNKKLIDFVLKQKASLMLGLFFLAYSISCAESFILIKLGYGSCISILRISNILYSITACFCFMNLFSRKQFETVLPTIRKNTYKIYLYHTIVFFKLYLVVNILENTISRKFSINLPPQTMFTFFIRYVIMFILVYVVTNKLIEITGAVKKIKLSKLKINLNLSKLSWANLF